VATHPSSLEIVSFRPSVVMSAPKPTSRPATKPPRLMTFRDDRHLTTRERRGLTRLPDMSIDESSLHPMTSSPVPLPQTSPRSSYAYIRRSSRRQAAHRAINLSSIDFKAMDWAVLEAEHARHEYPRKRGWLNWFICN